MKHMIVCLLGGMQGGVKLWAEEKWLETVEEHIWAQGKFYVRTLKWVVIGAAVPNLDGEMVLWLAGLGVWLKGLEQWHKK